MVDGGWMIDKKKKDYRRTVNSTTKKPKHQQTFDTVDKYNESPWRKTFKIKK